MSYSPKENPWGWISERDVEPPRNRSIFYSGFYRLDTQGDPLEEYRNQDLAELYRDAQEKMTGNKFYLIGDTERGKEIIRLQKERDEADQSGDLRHKEAAAELPTAAELEAFWHQASRMFAFASSGHVRTFVTGARAQDVFRRLEQGNLVCQRDLVENKQVSFINGLLRPRLEKIQAQNPERVFFEIAQAEIERDRRKVAQGRTFPEEMARQLQYRIERYHNTLDGSSLENERELRLVDRADVMDFNQFKDELRSLRASFRESLSRYMRVEGIPTNSPQGANRYMQNLRREYGAGAFGNLLSYEGGVREVSEDFARPLSSSEARNIRILLNTAAAAPEISQEYLPIKRSQ